MSDELENLNEKKTANETANETANTNLTSTESENENADKNENVSAQTEKNTHDVREISDEGAKKKEYDEKRLHRMRNLKSMRQ